MSFSSIPMFIKLSILSFFLFADLLLNCSLEYYELSSLGKDVELLAVGLVWYYFIYYYFLSYHSFIAYLQHDLIRSFFISFRFQIILQISIFFILFVFFAQTYLFRVGLLGFILSKFKYNFLSYLLYIGMTILISSMRLVFSSFFFFFLFLFLNS